MGFILDGFSVFGTQGWGCGLRVEVLKFRGLRSGVQGLEFVVGGSGVAGSGVAGSGVEIEVVVLMVQGLGFRFRGLKS